MDGSDLIVPNFGRSWVEGRVADLLHFELVVVDDFVERHQPRRDGLFWLPFRIDECCAGCAKRRVIAMEIPFVQFGKELQKGYFGGMDGLQNVHPCAIAKMAVNEIEDVIGPIAGIGSASVDFGVGDTVHTADVLVHFNRWSTFGTLMFQE